MSDNTKPPKPQKPRLEKPPKPKPQIISPSKPALAEPFEESSPSPVGSPRKPPRPPLSRTASPMPDLSERPTTLPQPPSIPRELDASPMQSVGQKSVEWTPKSNDPLDRLQPLPSRAPSTCGPSVLKPPSVLNLQAKLVNSSYINHTPPTCGAQFPGSPKALFALGDSILAVTAQEITLLGSGLTPVWALTFAGLSACCLKDDFLWIGAESGLVGCIDFEAGTLIFQRQAHNGAVKGMWGAMGGVLSVGVDGKLLAWDSGSETPRITRVAQGQVSSAVYGDGYLFCTSKNALNSYHVASKSNKTQQWPSKGTKGDFSAITTGHGEVFCGHNDGTLSAYKFGSCEGLYSVTLSIYGITAICFVNNDLWVGLSTGSVLVVDPSQLRILREWRACKGAVTSIMTFEEQVVTIGVDCSVWDPKFVEAPSNPIAKSELDVSIFSWNVDSRSPETMAPELVRNNCSGGMVVFGLQEVVELSNKTKAAKNLAGDQVQDYGMWKNYLMRALGSDYVFVADKALVGLYLVIFAKPELSVSRKAATLVKTGMGGLHGNKGAIAFTFNVGDSSFCLINCHLAAGHTEIIQRNRDAAQVLAAPVRGSMRPPDFDYCFFFGDTNYRINTAREAAVKHIKDENWARLEAVDQLNGQKRKNPGFCLNAFQEHPIAFPPTYKFDRNSDTYDSSSKKRVPAWCDRILFKGKVHVEQYDSVRTHYSDHRPVLGKFKVDIY